MIQIYPEKSEELELSLNEKSFLRIINRAFSEEDMAYYVLHINPRRKDAGNGKPELFNLLLINKGIILFRFLEITDLAAKATIKIIAEPVVHDVLINDIIKRLEESRYLTDKTGKLRFAVNVCYVLPNVDENKVINDLNNSEKEFCSKHILFQGNVLEIRKNGADTVRQYLSEGDELKEEYVNNVFQRLCPEITIPRKYIINDNEKIEGVDVQIDMADRAVL